MSTMIDIRLARLKFWRIRRFSPNKCDELSETVIALSALNIFSSHRKIDNTKPGLAGTRSGE